MKKKYLSILLLCSLLIGCGNTNTTPAVVEEEPPVVEEIEAPAMTQTPEIVEEEKKEEEEEPAMLVDDIYSNAGLVLVYENYDKYFKKKKIALRTSLINDAEATLWPYASYLESLSENVRRYPDNLEIREYYQKALDGLESYLVPNATIHAPAGDYENITYYNAGYQTAGDYYYDDNAWICYQMFEAYELLEDETYLNKALMLLDFFWTGYDDVCNGAIYWSKDYGAGKGICTNAPITICYLRGYQITGNEEYFERALSLYNWMVNSELMTSACTIHAGFTEDGKVDNWIAAYDQGTLIYATSLLYQITQDESYKEFAAKIEEGTYKLMFKKDNGKIVMKGNPIFKSWCVGWTVRGMVKYYELCNPTKHKFMDEFLNILDVELTTKNKIGQYDPYFSTGEWWDMEGYDTDVIQPSGMSSIFTISGYYHENIYNK